MTEKMEKERAATKPVEELVGKAVGGLREAEALKDGVLKQPRARRSVLLLAAERLKTAADLIEKTWAKKAKNEKA